MLKRKSEQVINIHSIQFDKDVLEAKYYMESPIHDDGRPDKGEDDNAADCDRIECFLALRIEQKGHNNLRLNSWYSPKENDPLKRYIVIEFRNQNDLEQLIEMLKPMEITKAFFSLDSKLDQKHMGAYCKALLKDSEKEMERRNSFLSMNSTNLSKYKFLEGKKESDILLVYPFTGDKLQIEQCGIGLNEVGNWESIPFNKSILSSLTNNENVEKSNAIHQDIGQNDSNEKTNLRGHFVEINVNDFSRLEHGEFLNDSLIDFWFQW